MSEPGEPADPGDPPKPKLTLDQLNKRREAARRNGRMGGRPPKYRTLSIEERLREKARAIGRPAIVTCARYWRELVEGIHQDATHAERIRAGENLMDRLGFPRRTEATVDAQITPAKIVEHRGWADESGEFHPERLDDHDISPEEAVERAAAAAGAEPPPDDAADDEAP